MKKLLTTVALSLSTLVAASAAMADPYDYHHGDRHHDRDRVVMTEHTVWKEGARFPDHYHDQRYYVDDYHHYNQLHKPNRFERWYKVDGRYVLVNERTHNVIRVVR